MDELGECCIINTILQHVSLPIFGFQTHVATHLRFNIFTITNQQSFFPIKVQNSPFPPSLKKCFSHDNCDPMFNLIGFVQYDIESSNFFHYFASFSAFSIPHSYQSFAAVQYFFKTFKNVGPLSQRLSYFPNFNFNFRIGNA